MQIVWLKCTILKSNMKMIWQKYLIYIVQSPLLCPFFICILIYLSCLTIVLQLVFTTVVSFMAGHSALSYMFQMLCHWSFLQEAKQFVCGDITQFSSVIRDYENISNCLREKLSKLEMEKVCILSSFYPLFDFHSKQLSLASIDFRKYQMNNPQIRKMNFNG